LIPQRTHLRKNFQLFSVEVKAILKREKYSIPMLSYISKLWDSKVHRLTVLQKE